jgi:hypothetical protein
MTKIKQEITLAGAAWAPAGIATCVRAKQPLSKPQQQAGMISGRIP